MIEKMKFLSITGPKSDIDRVVNEYMAKYEIHLENALAQLTEAQNITPYIQINPYKELLTKVNEFTELISDEKVEPLPEISLDETKNLVDSLSQKLSDINAEYDDLKKERTQIIQDLNTITPFFDLPADVNELVHYRFVQARFGRIAKEYYGKLKEYLYDKLDAWFYPCHEDEYVWGVYFVPWTKMLTVDAIFSSMHFERIYIQKDYFHGTPQQIYDSLHERLDTVDKHMDSCMREIQTLLRVDAPAIFAAKQTLNALSTNFDVRKVAACVQEHHETFYILCGWMTEKDAIAFQKDIEDDVYLFCVVEDEKHDVKFQPPTKLNNPKIFKPFESYIRMYGLPCYNEIDPTIFVALTYTFIFGIMFGDVGQGLLLVIGGFLLYKFKKMDLAAIIGTAGIFSTIFGFMFGSIFGFEDVLPAIWLKPLDAMMDVPGLGNMNTVFIVAVVFGMFLILVTMIFHIINAVKSHDAENIYFDQNAICGLVFYGSLTTVALLFLTGHTLPGTAVLVVMFVVPLILIMLKEPLARLVNKKTPLIEDGKVMFFVQSFFELFEVMLSYLSNTLSFVRIGAFAVSHAAMMGVVLMLGGAESASPNWLVIVLGNAFVIAMEGLIVGIQVLRLEYYEMFSRFYTGSGKEFRPFLKKVKNKKNNA